MFSFKYEIATKLKPLDQEILMELRLKQHEMETLVSTYLIDLKEKALREALIQLGWTPPPQ